MTRARLRILWLFVFAAAFGFVEAAVVVYLRALYYPDGFGFPLALPETRILTVEVCREVATLVMLWGAAMLAGTTGWTRFGAFCFAFGVWDLVFYLGLWAVLRWPPSLLTWDVLFLVPLVWVGPVLSAVLMAVSLVGAGAYLMNRGAWRPPALRPGIVLLAAASLVLLLFSFMANHAPVRATGVPGPFPWIPYLLGLVAGWSAFTAGILAKPGPGARRRRRKRIVDTRF